MVWTYEIAIHFIYSLIDMLENPSHKLKILLVALLAGGAGLHKLKIVLVALLAGGAGLHKLKIVLVALLAGGAGLSTLILVTTDWCRFPFWALVESLCLGSSTRVIVYINSASDTHTCVFINRLTPCKSVEIKILFGDKCVEDILLLSVVSNWKINIDIFILVMECFDMVACAMLSKIIVKPAFYLWYGCVSNWCRIVFGCVILAERLTRG